MDFLGFATEKFGATIIKGWSVTVEHIEDPCRWIDLFDVARHTEMDPGEWPTNDAWSFAWDAPSERGFFHVTDHSERQRLSKRKELEDFDPKISAKAIEYDLVIFINDAYAIQSNSIDFLRYLMPTDFLHYLIAHECLHHVGDWIGRELVKDNVPPSQDQIVIATLNSFIEKIGGLDEFKRRYT